MVQPSVQSCGSDDRHCRGLCDCFNNKQKAGCRKESKVKRISKMNILLLAGYAYRIARYILLEAFLILITLILSKI